MDDVQFDHEVFVDELPAVCVVRMDAADFCRHQHHVFRFFLSKKIFDRRLIHQIQFVD